MAAVTQHTLSHHFLFMDALLLPSLEFAFQQVINVHFEKQINSASVALMEFSQEN